MPVKRKLRSKRPSARKQAARTNPEANPFSPFRKGRGKPSLRPEYLLNEREKFLYLIESRWYALEWKLSQARTLEGLRKAFATAEFMPIPDPLAPLLREKSEPVTRKQFEQTSKQLGQANAASRAAGEEYQEQLRRSNDANGVAFSVSEDAENNLRQDSERWKRL